MNQDPAIIRLEGLDLLILTLFVLIVGEFVYGRVGVLRKYNIPSVVIGGIACSIVLGVLNTANLVRVEFGRELLDLFLLVFFSTVGLSIKFRALREIARPMLVMLILATALLIFQNMVGSAIAGAFGFPPVAGLIAGSVTLMGGHGTGIAWSGIFIERFGMQTAEQGVLAVATLGLVAGGLLGGPLAEFLIRRHGLQGGADAEAEIPSTPEKHVNWEGVRPSMLTSGVMVALCVYAAPVASGALSKIGVTLPGFVIALILGAVLANLAGVCRVELNNTANTLISDISLQLFLAMSIMNIQLSYLFNVAVPLLVVCALQMVLVLIFVYYTVFSVMGRNYESAVLCAGFTGFSLGSSLIGIGNMRAVTRKYGAAPAAFIIVPVVGSFLIDIVNSFVIQLYLLSSVLK